MVKEERKRMSIKLKNMEQKFQTGYDILIKNKEDEYKQQIYVRNYY